MTRATKALRTPGWEYPEPVTEESLLCSSSYVRDYRDQNGPRLTYLWCEKDEETASNYQAVRPSTPPSPLTGQSLYLGAVSVGHFVYCIPGHAERVLKIDTCTDRVTQIGPRFPGKFKWLRGVLVRNRTEEGKETTVIYGIPCHADCVLRIHVPSEHISTLPIPFCDCLEAEMSASAAAQQPWKYHGGDVLRDPTDRRESPIVFAIPQSAPYVLKIANDVCTLVGPALAGKYKWYGGVVGQDGALYGIPHNSPHVLRIHARGDTVSLHGQLGTGGHKWHGAAAAADGTIVAVPANADRVLCIRAGDKGEPRLTVLPPDLTTGRHRQDRKYKYLGAMTGSDGKVYCFPSGSEQVLQIDADKERVKCVGPNIFDEKLEVICQNKWQNGLTLADHGCVYAIPLAALSVLRVDCTDEEPDVTTWELPLPAKGLAKWEGGVVASNGHIYCVPNNHKAVLKIEQAGKSRLAAKEQLRVRPTEEEMKQLVYRSGIPTLRSSAHRVKLPPGRRKHNPNPRDNLGVETGTTWLPEAVRRECIFSYDLEKYDLEGALIDLLKECDPLVIGSFREATDDDSVPHALSSSKLEDFVVPTESTWRSVNGGRCEEAQENLSGRVFENDKFLAIFDRLVVEVVLPHLKSRLIECGAIPTKGSIRFYYQRPPTLRLQPGPAWAQVKPHDDAQYGHQNGELNMWLPLTDRELTTVDLYCESAQGTGDYHAIAAKPGEIVSFHGSSCRHFVNTNATHHTRVSMDFRVGVEGFFDPFWQMKGTTNDHGRCEVSI